MNKQNLSIKSSDQTCIRQGQAQNQEFGFRIMDLGHIPDTQGYLGLLAKPSKSYCVFVVANKILETVQNPNPFFPFWIWA